MGEKKWSNIIFAGLFALALVLFARIVLPFAMPVLLGGFLVVLFQPLHRLLRRHLPGHPGLAAGLATLSVFALILAPLAVVGWVVARELLLMVDGAAALLERGDLQREVLASLPASLRRFVQVPLGTGELERSLMGAVSGSASLLGKAVGAGTALALDTFLMTVSVYYFFLDGRRLVAESARLVPLDSRYFLAFCKEFRDVAYAIVYGSTLTALVQAAVGLVGLMLAGVPHAGVWGMAMALAAFIPVGGTALVWGPIGLGLLATGHSSEGLFLLGWGTLLVSSVDNVVRPWLCGARMTLHPLLIFLSMFGGLSVFGMMGLLVGPLIASLFMTMVRIYRRDFLKVPERAEPEPTPVPVEGLVQMPVVTAAAPAAAALGGQTAEVG